MNRVRERATNTLEHLEMSALGRRVRHQPEPEPELDESGSGWMLFFWGALTALALWWLYLRPVTTERRLQELRPGRRPGPRPGSRPANARPPQYREPAQTITPAAEMPEGEEQAEDDLTLIFGIGPARFARLREAGITTFAALAIADIDQLHDILSGVGGGIADVATWAEQASLAAKGDWEGFEAMQEQLRAERE